MSKGAQQSQQQDSSMSPIWISLALTALVFLIWYIWSEQIVFIVYKLKLYQALFMSHFTDKLDSTIQYLSVVQINGVTFEEMVEVTERVGQFVVIPYILILILLAVILYFNNAGTRFKKKYTMKDLRRQEYVNWPQITPVAKLNLVETDINKGDWAMSLSPMEFARKHNLLIRNGSALKVAKGIKTATIKRSDAKRVFTLQLGLYWEGIKNLKDHQAALFAVFAARINQDRDPAEQLLLQINLSAGEGKLDFRGAWVLLKKHYQSKKVQEIVTNHAYFYTVMASLIRAARKDGVLPTSTFIWLKPFDRRLWYMLNTIGRQTPFPEVAGPYAHWLVECELERRSVVPMIDEAVDALDIAVKEVKITMEQFMELGS